jgi:hypothetical protein
MEILRKIGTENRKANELGFQGLVPSSHLLGYMEATESLKCPFLIIRDTSPSKADLEVFMSSPSDGCPATVSCVASTQVMRSRRVSCASKSPDCVVAHRSDRYPPVRPDRPVRHYCSTVFGSSVLALWINQGTQWFSGEPPETPQTRCSLHQSPLMTRLPRSPGSTLVSSSTKKPSMTSSCCSCHHAAHT